MCGISNETNAFGRRNEMSCEMVMSCSLPLLAWEILDFWATMAVGLRRRSGNLLMARVRVLGLAVVDGF